MKPTILIVHQDDRDRKRMHGILSNFEFDLIYTNDGLSGLQAARYLKPDLVICEIELKLIDGLTLGKNIRNDEEISETPLIFLHHELDLVLIEEAKKLSSRAFLIKPYVDNSIIYGVKRGLRKAHLVTSADRSPVPYEECFMNVSANQRYV
ncbi:response regulator [Fulvivirga sp. M361]|uniref:response regulator n=1 Tax=Fulvivirga sp. M361 TaxID=2594266 RepID=UPI00117A3E33|nr:response regulator [Fulvivirga sp. M361]TRX58708.1 response regulator [Fulvivirga sp. M361]